MPPSFPPAQHRPRPTAPPARARARRDATDPTAQLRLAIARAGLGMELAQPVRLGCLEVTELDLAITTVRFPLDVSGGVSRFRHRRGELQRLVVDLGARDLERWAAPLLRGLLGPRAPEVWVGVRKGGATVALLDAGPERAAVAPPPRILAFELTVSAAEEDTLHVCVTRARGAGLPAPATTLALRAAAALLGRSAAREGSRFVLLHVARAIARALLPDAGVRAPGAEGVRWTGLAAQTDRWIAVAARDGALAESTPEAALAGETCTLTREADDARADGDTQLARELDVRSLERAPRHPEIVRRIAEIDALAGGRAEAALATFAQATPSSALPGDTAGPPGVHGGPLMGELYAESGDTAGAIASFVRAGETEPVPALGARAFERASELTKDPLDALVWLDLAIARAPTLAHLRWTRLGRRLAAGRLEDALADAEHLEAQARGARARHAVWRRAGDAWVDAGLVSSAAPIFERALRFEPDDPEAIAGLGAALASAGRAARGAALLAHAIELAERASPVPVPTARMAIDLATVLVHPLEDRPAAIARVQSIPGDAPEALLARGLEGRWRAELGDLAGASLAFARLRDLASSHAIAGAKEALLQRAQARVVDLLVEAATFERDRRGDALAAQRLLACALRLLPRHPAALRAYEEVGLEIAGRPLPAPAPPPDSEEEGALHDSQEDVEAEPAGRAILTERPPSHEPFDFEPDAPAVSGYPGESEDAARVDELTRLLQSDPTQDAIVDELAQRLTRLGRTHELLALLSARLEDAAPERRAQLVPQQHAVLERLEHEARVAGRDLEAAFFRDAMKMLG